MPAIVLKGHRPFERNGMPANNQVYKIASSPQNDLSHRSYLKLGSCYLSNHGVGGD